MVRRVFQTFNNRIKAYVKFKRFANGRTKVLNVKQKKKDVPFAGVPIVNKFN